MKQEEITKYVMEHFRDFPFDEPGISEKQLSIWLYFSDGKVTGHSTMNNAMYWDGKGNAPMILPLPTIDTVDEETGDMSLEYVDWETEAEEYIKEIKEHISRDTEEEKGGVI